MVQILQKCKLGDHIPEGAKNKSEDHALEKGNSRHALITINSSDDTKIVDSSASDHMASTNEAFYSLDECKGPPILMGDDSSIKITNKGMIELHHGTFDNVLHVQKVSLNLLYVYQITNLELERELNSLMMLSISLTYKQTLKFPLVR